MKKRNWIFFILLVGCQKPPFEKQTTESTCILHDGKYPVQSATYNKTKSSYELFTLNTPSCWSQPATASGITLGRLEESENEQALLEVINNKPSALLVSSTFKLMVVETIVENGAEKTTPPSAWTPFLSAAAGGIAGGIIANKMADRAERNSASDSNSTKSRLSTDQKSAKTEAQDTSKERAFFKSKKGTTKIYQKGNRRNATSSNGFFKKKRK